MKFFAKVTKIGELARDFMEEGILVFFADEAPEELQEAAIVHSNEHPLSEDVVPGDLIRLGEMSFEVLAVGSVANENFRNLGHLVLKFNGLKEVELDGDITVAKKTVPDIFESMEIEVCTAKNK